MPDAKLELTTLLGDYHAAMVGAHVDALDALLDGGYSLVHITGYQQFKNEWLAVIRSGQFDYDTIHIDQAALSLAINDEHAAIAGRGVFDATINGMHAPWRLRFQLACSRQAGRWRIMSARYYSDSV